MKPQSSPKYTAAVPARPGQPDIKISKKDTRRSFKPTSELHSFFTVEPLLDPEERVDRSVRFMFVGRPDIDEGDTQGRHIHAYALYREAMYSVLEKKAILEIPRALHEFMEQHKHYYNATDDKKRQYDERVTGFIFQITDEESSTYDKTIGTRERTTQDQRAQAERLDKDMFSYFEERCREILKTRGILDIDIRELSKLRDLSADEEKVVSLYSSFCYRQNYLTANDIRANMKDAEYLVICSMTNELISEAIEIINAMPGITFQYEQSQGSGEKDGLRWLREENAKPVVSQDPKAIALNMRRLIDFPVGFFGLEEGANEGYDLKEVLANHIELVHAAFPNVQINEKVLEAFVAYFADHDPFIDEKDGKEDRITWDNIIEVEQLYKELVDNILPRILTPNHTALSAAKGAGLAAAAKGPER